MPVEIPVVIDSASAQQMPSMNVEPILHEVQYALEKLLKLILKIYFKNFIHRELIL